MSRPALAKGRRLCAQLNLRLTSAEMQALVDLAAFLGRTPTDVARAAIRAHMEGLRTAPAKQLSLPLE